MTTNQKRQILMALKDGIITKNDLNDKELLNLIITQENSIYVRLGDQITCKGVVVSIEHYNKIKAISQKLGRWIEYEIKVDNCPPLADNDR